MTNNRKEKAQQEEFASVLRGIVSKGMERSKEDLLKMNILEYARDILGVQLWPTQTAMLKALYGIPYSSGKWSDILSPDKMKDFGFEPDEIWDERQILQNWKDQGKTNWEDGKTYVDLNLEAGMRSSKTSMTSVPASFEFFKLSLMDDPAAEFGLLKGSLIAMLVIATNEQQAEDTLFAAIRGRIENSPYFQAKIDSGEIIVNRLEILCPEKNIKLWAGHSSGKAMVGRTLMFFGMDECDRFGLEGQGGPDGLELFTNIGKGCLTLRRFGSRKFTISSAWKDKDLTDTLHGLAMSGANPQILSFQLCTWDMNPEFMKLGEMHPEIQAEYNTRGVEAMRDYACIRPGVAELFFNKYMLADCPKALPVVSTEPYENTVINANDGTQRTYSANRLIVPDVKLNIGPYFSFGHCDPGLSHDSFGFVGLHPDYDEDGQLIAVVNSVIEWRPVDKGRGNIYKVDYENVNDTLIQLAPRIKLNRLSFDHWNAAMMIQRLYAVGVSTSEYKSSFSQVVQREMYMKLREWINMKRIKLPPRDFSPATEKLYKELEELRLLNGRRINHPPKGSKDLSDCLAAALARLIESERMFSYAKLPEGGMPQRIKPIGETKAKEPFEDVFGGPSHDARVNNILASQNPLRNPKLPGGGSKRRTAISKNDWYSPHDGA